MDLPRFGKQLAFPVFLFVVLGAATAQMWFPYMEKLLLVGQNAPASPRANYCCDPSSLTNGSNGCWVTGGGCPQGQRGFIYSIECEKFCQQTYTSTVCGDGSREEGEMCDDGNMTDRDGCSSFCNIEGGWQCTTGGGASSSTCANGAC